MNLNDISPLDKDFQLDRYWKIIKPRLHILAACIILALVVGVAKSFNVTPEYRAQGTLMIAPEHEGTITFNDRLLLRRPDMEYFNTQVRILRSRTLAKRVIEALSDSGFQRLPGDDTLAGGPGSSGGDNNINRKVGRFLASLNVRPVRDTRLVEVSYTHRNGERAAALVNTLFEKYIKFNRQLQSASTRETSEFIEKQMNALQDSLRQKEEELQNYGKSKDLVYLSNEENAEVGKFSDLSRAFTNAQIERLNLETEYHELRGKDYKEFPDVRNSNLVNSMKNRVSTLETDYNRRAEVYKESYPQMVQLKSQLDTLRGSIEKETRDIAEKSLAQARTQYEAAMEKERSLKDMLDKQKKEMGESNSNAIYYKSLSIEVENMRNLQNYLDRKHKEALLTSSNEGAQLSNIKIIDPADVPRRPIQLNRKMLLIMAAVLGFAIGLALIFLFHILDRTIKNPEDVKNFFDVPTLGIIPSASTRPSYYTYIQYLSLSRKPKDNRPQSRQVEMINYNDPESPLSESYRNIRTSILLSTAGQPPRVIAVSSARPEEGKTSTATNLAIAFQQLGKRVLLIDADLRKPRIHKIFRLKNTKGLSSFLTGCSKWRTVVHKTDIPDLSIIPSGPIPPNPVELLNSDIMEAFIKEQAAMQYDFVFLDSPPLIDIMDPVLLGKLSDGMILVTWGGKTNRNEIEKAIEQMKQFDIRLLGLVLNKVNLRTEGYGYQYSYKAEKEEEENSK